jgi:cytochrome c peroxidase
MRHRLVRIVSVLAAVGAVAFAVAQTTTDPPPPPSLKTVPVPEPPNLYDFVQDKAAAIRLGKALFWDMQVGSDGVVACATCHFNAGADSRSINQINPGMLMRDARAQPAPDHAFDKGVNATLTADMFPLRVLKHPRDRSSDAKRDSNDVVSSQGVFNTVFESIVPGQPEELVSRPPDADFNVAGLNVRRVEPRHAPSVINAVFNHRNFWDGRAQNEFNGVNQWGDRDPSATVLKVDKNSLVPVTVRLVNASLASQAVAPIVNTLEMSADGRDVNDLANKLAKNKGKKISGMQPLSMQLVHPEDSVLGTLSNWPQPGVNTTYATLIQSAFRPEWWNSSKKITVGEKPDSVDYTLMEYNFSLFFGLALQLYQATLVSDDSPYDQWREGRATLSTQALLGLEVFLGQAPRVISHKTTRAGGRCINCHAGPEFTDASVSNILAKGVTRTREGQYIDRGWNNIGVRPTLDDVAVGGKDAFGKPLSITRSTPPTNPSLFIAVDGAFKAPSLRNVELTAPYFHNGGYLTLESVVQFYSRGGDFSPLLGLDGTQISPLSIPNMSVDEQAGMVAFLKSLTDERVRNQSAPFDHPQLFIPHGQLNDQITSVQDPSRPMQALDRMREIPAVGKNGGTPLPLFMQFR